MVKKLNANVALCFTNIFPSLEMCYSLVSFFPLLPPQLFCYHIHHCMSVFLLFILIDCISHRSVIASATDASKLMSVG